MGIKREIVKQIMDERNLTLQEISDGAEIKYSTLNTWYNGGTRQMGGDKNIRLAKFFGVSVEYLSGEGEIYEAQRVEEAERSTQGESDVTIETVPVIEERAEGNPVISFDDPIPFVQLPDAPSPDFCVLVNDNSMELFDIHEGDVVFCENASDVPDGEVAAVIFNESTILRRVYKSPVHPDTIILSAGTPEHAPIFVPNDKKTARVIGRAVSVLKAMRLLK